MPSYVPECDPLRSGITYALRVVLFVPSRVTALAVASQCRQPDPPARNGLARNGRRTTGAR